MITRKQARHLTPKINSFAILKEYTQRLRATNNGVVRFTARYVLGSPGTCKVQRRGFVPLRLTI